MLDANGNGTIKVNLAAAGVQPGNHTLHILATNIDGTTVLESMPVTVRQPFPTILWLAIGIAILALVGAATFSLRARRQRTAPTNELRKQ